MKKENAWFEDPEDQWLMCTKEEKRDMERMCWAFFAHCNECGVQSGHSMGF